MLGISDLTGQPNRWEPPIHQLGDAELLKSVSLRHLLLLEELFSLAGFPAILAHRSLEMGAADALCQVRI